MKGVDVKTFSRFLIISVAISNILAFAVAGQVAIEAMLLAPNQTIEREIKGSESNRYRIELRSGEFFQVRVEQKGVDVALKLLDADGATLASMDSPNGKEGPETLTFVASHAGKFVLDVSCIDAKAEKGVYKVTRALSRDAVPSDIERVAVERSFIGGINAVSAGDYESAIKIIEGSLVSWNALNEKYLADLAGQYLPVLKKAVAHKNLSDALKLKDADTKDSLQQALKKLGVACDYFRQTDEKKHLGHALALYANVVNDLGDRRTALNYYLEALRIVRSLNDKYWESIVLNRIGEIYIASFELPKALETLNLALEVSKAAGKKRIEAETLSNLGHVFYKVADLNKAGEYFLQALKLFNEIDDKVGEASILVAASDLYIDTGKYQEALYYLNLALTRYRTLGNKGKEANCLNSIAAIYHTLKDNEKAISHHQQALELSRISGDQGTEAATLNNIGFIYYEAGEQQKALANYYKALTIFTAVGHKNSEAKLLRNIMFAWNATNPAVAIFYGKQSVNRYQELREGIQQLDKVLQKSYLQTVEVRYREFADLLIANAQFAHAERVLAMLKDEEYFDFVRRDAGEIGKLNERIPLDAKEQALVQRYSQLSDKVVGIAEQFNRLDDKKRALSRTESTLSADEQLLYSELEKQLNDANAAFQLFLTKQLVSEVGKEKAEGIAVDRNLQDKLRKWGEGTVALFTIAGADRYRVVLTTPKIQVDGKTEIKIADLNKKVFAFRAALQNPRIDPRPLGKELYDILIRPVEKELKTAKAKTLVWSLDGTLRYIPLGALSPDGKKYLIEDFNNAIITQKTRDDLTDSNSNWQAVGFGVSEAGTVKNPDNGVSTIAFDPLPGTARELAAIVKDDRGPKESGILPGRRYMDKDFTTAILKDALGKESLDGKKQYNLIHIASHFRLGNNWSNSFLLLGNGEILTLEEINNSSSISFGDVDLVTLSACNTGFADNSNGKEIDSLASVIQTKSGKAVLASLWAVSDESTSLLMSEFYRQRRENPKLTKAAAMQAAQKAMITGKLRSSGPAAGCRSDKIELEGTSTAFNCDANAPFSHPYFWSPFILIGNWR